MTDSTFEPPLLLATNNAHKVTELRALFAGCGWRLTTPAELRLSLDPEETGETYAANARIKARAFAEASGGWALADDSGLEVVALGGAPGIHSARYAGADTPHEQKILALLAELGAQPGSERDASFRAAFALVAPDGRVWESEGVWEGALAEAARGANGFGYDPIFVPHGEARTSAEMSSDEKNLVSHRARAAIALLPALRALAALSDPPTTAAASTTGVAQEQSALVDMVRLTAGAVANTSWAESPHETATGESPAAKDFGANVDMEEARRGPYESGDTPAITLSHIDSSGQARMVDVSAKDETRREAVAAGRVLMRTETLALIEGGGIAKGNVLATARIAGIMAAKRTHELIPMCHPLLLTGIEVALTADAPASAIEIRATVRTTGKTGVEMEALTAVSVAALTIYDMCKAVDRAMRIEAVRLLEKRGGKSGDLVLE